MRVRVTGDDAPYGEHFVVWGACAPTEEEEDRIFDLMAYVRAYDIDPSYPAESDPSDWPQSSFTRRKRA